MPAEVKVRPSSVTLPLNELLPAAIVTLFWNLVEPVSAVETMPEFTLTVDRKSVRPLLLRVIAAPVPSPRFVIPPLNVAVFVSPADPMVKSNGPVSVDSNVIAPVPVSIVIGPVKVVAEL